MAEPDGLIAFNWKRFMRSWDDAASTFGVASKTLFWGTVFLSIAASIFGWLYGREEGMKKFEWGAIGFIVPWAFVFVVMLIRFFFVTPHKMHSETLLKHEEQIASKNAQIDELKAKTAVNPQDRMRLDKLAQYIAELEVIKENIVNREQKGIPQFNKVNDACADFVATAFPEFHDYPTKPRPQDVQQMRHNQEDFITYEKKCENAVNALYKLKQYYT